MLTGPGRTSGLWKDEKLMGMVVAQGPAPDIPSTPDLCVLGTESAQTSLWAVASGGWVGIVV